jgi:nitrate reductase cytochrome c-type subunit
MMKRPVILLTFLTMCCLALVGYASTQGGVPEKEIGLSKASVFDAPVPPSDQKSDSWPGQNHLLPRVNPVGPPAIPHMIGGFLPITLGRNPCMGCHRTDQKIEGGPVPIPESHYIDYRNGPGQKQDAPVGARYYCLSCHVTQTDAPPLVKNQFSE